MSSKDEERFSYEDMRKGIPGPENSWEKLREGSSLRTCNALCGVTQTLILFSFYYKKFQT